MKPELIYDYIDDVVSIEDDPKKHKFYAIVITESESDVFDSIMVTKLSGFTTNEWIYRQYVNRFKKSFDALPYVSVELENVTYKEFIDEINTVADVVLNLDNQILYSELPLIDFTLFYTKGMLDELYDYQNDCGDFLVSNINSIYATYDMVFGKLSKYFKLEGFEPFLGLIKKVSKIYVPLIKMSEICDENYEGEWFLSMPDDIKVQITMGANFPGLIESRDYYDFFSEPYALWFYLYHIICIDDIVK